MKPNIIFLSNDELFEASWSKLSASCTLISETAARSTLSVNHARSVYFGGIDYGNSDFCLYFDVRNKSYDIARRNGGKWETYENATLTPDERLQLTLDLAAFDQRIFEHHLTTQFVTLVASIVILKFHFLL